jgi:hypothetical protein
MPAFVDMTVMVVVGALVVCGTGVMTRVVHDLHPHSRQVVPVPGSTVGKPYTP